MLSCFFFNDTATTEIYTLSLHDALPIYRDAGARPHPAAGQLHVLARGAPGQLHRAVQPEHLLDGASPRSEEHTSELQSRQYLVCRLLLEKKNQRNWRHHLVTVHENNNQE